MLLTGLLVTLLAYSGATFINLDPDFVSRPISLAINVVCFLLFGLVLSLVIHQVEFYKILIVLGLLVPAMFADRYMPVSANPITPPLMILFWVGVAYLIIPQFFQKYKVAILAVYGAVICYHFFQFGTAPLYEMGDRRDIATLMLIPLPVFAALWGYEQWRWLRMLKADKAKAELTSLKNQINPHFFFNTLNNLYGLAVEKSDQAPAMILKLSDIMRYTIYEGREEYVPLGEEVTYLEDYIYLHKIRYQKQVDISFTKDLQHAHKIAPLLLVVPLENAFKHGVESLAGQAFIELSLHTTAEHIFFRIHNNYEPNEQEKGGIGLENLKKRLELMYPKQHQLKITQTENTYTLSLEIAAT